MRVTQKAEAAVAAIFLVLALLTCACGWEDPIFWNEWVWQIFLWACFFSFWLLVCIVFLIVLHEIADRIRNEKIIE